MSEERLTASQWRRRAERAETKYQKLRNEIELIRSKDFADTIELCDHRCNTEQVRALLIEAIQWIDNIRSSEEEAKRLYQIAVAKEQKYE